jgi:hypothetical protein
MVDESAPEASRIAYIMHVCIKADIVPMSRYKARRSNRNKSLHLISGAPRGAEFLLAHRVCEALIAP